MARNLIKGALREWTPAKGPMTVGTIATLTRSFDADAVAKYAALAGDDNPVHLNPEYAATTRFKKPIVHGMLYSSLFGTIFGAAIPGSIYMSQSFKFRKPVYVGETITAHIEVMEVKTAPLHTARCRTAIVKEDGSTATEGEAMVMLPPPEAPAAAAGAAGAAGSSAAPLR